MMEVHNFIKNLESFGYSLTDLGFGFGASDSQVSELETVLSRQLPEEFKVFLKYVNGQCSDKFLFLPDLALFFSTGEIASEYNLQREYFDDTASSPMNFNFKTRYAVLSGVSLEYRLPAGTAIIYSSILTPVPTELSGK